MTAVAPPTSLPSGRPSLRHRLRARRARSRAGVTTGTGVRLGRAVVIDVAPSARLVLGDGCSLMDGCRLHVLGGVVRIGAEAVLGERCVVVAHESIDVGRAARLGDGVVLVDFRPDHADVERPVRQQPISTAPVHIGEGARIGGRAVLGPGAVVQDGGTLGTHQTLAGPAPRPAGPAPAAAAGHPPAHRR